MDRANYPSCAMEVARGLERELVKLIFEMSSGRLLGAHMTGKEASAMIQQLVLALANRLTAADIYRQIYIRNALHYLDPCGGVVF